MILEVVRARVLPGRAEQFAAAVAQGRPLLAAVEGFLSLEVRGGLEDPDQVLLLIGWERLEDHMEGFRGSPGFARWRELTGPFYAEPPLVEHYRLLGSTGAGPSSS